jgi:hypothetical protein
VTRHAEAEDSAIVWREAWLKLGKPEKLRVYVSATR